MNLTKTTMLGDETGNLSIEMKPRLGGVIKKHKLTFPNCLDLESYCGDRQVEYDRKEQFGLEFVTLLLFQAHSVGTLTRSNNFVFPRKFLDRFWGQITTNQREIAAFSTFTHSNAFPILGAAFLGGMRMPSCEYEPEKGEGSNRFSGSTFCRAAERMGKKCGLPKYVRIDLGNDAGDIVSVIPEYPRWLLTAVDWLAKK